MMKPGIVSPLCVLLAALITAPEGLTQVPPIAAPAPGPGPAKPVKPEAPVEPLRILFLEGNNTINSIPLMRAVSPVIEVHDQNDFPIEGATVVFTLPDIGPGGTFPGGATTFSTRTDSHGQAGTPSIIPRTAGKFQIKVAATHGTQKGEAFVSQTNSPTNEFGPPVPKQRWYTKKKNLIILGSAIAAGVVVIILTTGGSSSSSTIVVTPGTPVFH